MFALSPRPEGRPLRVVCLGAHADDIEIGAGATLLKWIEDGPVEATWVVLAAPGGRDAEARASARDFLNGAAAARVETAAFTDSYFPAEYAAVKERLAAVRAAVPAPDVVLTHWSGDAHQDHRVVAELAWNLWRDQLILEYEIPKWDGDLGRPNVYVPVPRRLLEAKTALLENHFGSQRSKDWFSAETFAGLARLRGVECRAPEGVAEAFHCRKIVLG